MNRPSNQPAARLAYASQAAAPARPKPIDTANAAQVAAVICYALAFFAFSFSWPISRSLGPPALAVLLLAALLPIFVVRRFYLPLPLFAFWALSFVYFAFSYFSFLPESWPIFFDRNAIPQHVSAYLILPILLSANIASFSVIGRNRTLFLRWLLPAIIIGSFLVNPLVLTLMEPLVEGQEVGIFFYLGINGFSSSEVFMIGVLGYLLLTRMRGLLLLIVSTTFAVISTNLSPFIAFAILPFFKHGQLARITVLGLIVVLLASAIIAPIFWPELAKLDGNTGIRAVFWGDAWRALADTWGVGVGFGTESIRPYYIIEGAKWILRPPDADDFLLVGLHNSFVQVLFRMGIVGLLLMLLLVLRIRPRGASISQQTRFDCWLFCVLFISMSVNVAIVSIHHLLGSTAIWAWLAFRHDSQGIYRL